MHIRILGSGAGGGFPQWNCNCKNCRTLREGNFQGPERTQSSITVSSDNENWVLFNASPDIRAQLESFPPLQPARAVRDTGICAIVIVDAQIDHTTGLLMLRASDLTRSSVFRPRFSMRRNRCSPLPDNSNASNSSTLKSSGEALNVPVDFGFPWA